MVGALAVEAAGWRGLLGCDGQGLHTGPAAAHTPEGVEMSITSFHTLYSLAHIRQHPGLTGSTQHAQQGTRTLSTQG